MKTSKIRQVPMTVLGIIFLCIMIFPIYWMLNSSLQTNGSATSSSFFPLHPDFSGYQTALSQQTGNLVTSLIISIGSVIVSLVIAAPAAYALAKFKIKWISVVLIALLIAQMIPGIVIANALYTAYNHLGLLNTLPGLILADASNGIPFAILILRAFMGSIPPSLVEAARVDGASHFRAFVSIVLPISRNSIITAALFSFLFTWSDFVFALTLTTGNSIKPVTLGIYTYLSGNVQQWSPVMATAVLSSIPAIVLLIFAQRYIAAGALGGAVK
ncbi:ABC transporter permease [Frondihabitans sp. PAMC 28766]|uniref:carbohydrate ABC transporter permease n=1 Tax=Frondihabitans sp. PAMC 28766 TaxID=1795630 RepID=UPI00078CA9B9|nr:carbohydrate ABC transporter permease [Frondihabitans sp. PAMC 28766]AMM19144.1 ABC transporter permease [Frondihabitans sp. PAMC 28766]